jgi:hypothetical protein
MVRRCIAGGAKKQILTNATHGRFGLDRQETDASRIEKDMALGAGEKAPSGADCHAVMASFGFR